MLLDLNRYQINEGAAAPVIYHYNPIKNALCVLRDNNFALTPGFTVEADDYFNRGYTHYMSCSTHNYPNMGYSHRKSSHGWVRWTMDANKLSNNYKFVPVNYWENNDPKARWKKPSTDEMEDRLLSNRMNIPNFTDYVIRVDLFGAEKLEKEVIDSFYHMCIERDLECCVYSGPDESSEKMSDEINTEMSKDKVAEMLPKGVFNACVELTPVYIGHPDPEAFIDKYAEKKAQFHDRFDMLDKFKETAKQKFEETFRYYYFDNHNDLWSRYKDSLNDLSRRKGGEWCLNIIFNDMSKYKCKGDFKRYIEIKKALLRSNYSYYDIYFKSLPLMEKVSDKMINEWLLEEYEADVLVKINQIIKGFLHKCFNSLIDECIFKFTRVDLSNEYGVSSLLYSWTVPEYGYPSISEPISELTRELEEGGIEMSYITGCFISELCRKIPKVLSKAIEKTIPKETD